MVIGDWMGSQYGPGGKRYDWHLFLDSNNRFESITHFERTGTQSESGRWKYDATGNFLELIPESAEGNIGASCGWWVLSVTTCEDSNVILVLRQAILASRNLPIVLYRVHRNDRGYVTDSQNNKPK